MQTQPEISIREVTQLENARLEEKLRENSYRGNLAGRNDHNKNKLPIILVMVVSVLLIVLGAALMFMAGTIAWMNPVHPLW
jgi:hypothetical protein